MQVLTLSIDLNEDKTQVVISDFSYDLFEKANIKFPQEWFSNEMKRLNIKVFSRDKFDTIVDSIERQEDINQKILVEGYAGVPPSDPKLVAKLKIH